MFTMFFGVIIVIGLIVLAYLIIDFNLGRKRHLETVAKIEFPKRYSDLQLFTDGGKLFKEMFNDLRSAKEHIHALFYIVQDDHISKEFFDILKEKAKQGVEVRLLLDWVGSKNVKKQEIEKLKQSGVEFYYCHIPKAPFFFYTFNERNHRKITVVDGNIGFVGGFNVGKEYLGQDPKYGVWRDYHLKMTGEGVQDLQKQFLEDWLDDSKIDLLENTKYFPASEKGKTRHQIVPTNGAFLTSTFKQLLKCAQNEVVICTPYFVPSDELMEELLQTLGRGVKVKIVVPQKEDHPLLRDAAFNYFPTLMEAGAEVYRFFYGFFHAKVIIVDSELCDIGTANFDKRSLHINHEINCIIFDKEFVRHVREKVDSDLATAERLTEEFLHQRGLLEKSKQQVAKVLSPLL
ncbi:MULTISPECIES: cardiolipin synthase [Bacillus]|uniref:cardiolipin synthase n=1 Tax=Bacillus TaxID=1386 RepID=UPI001D0D3954|nr:MULTISPECIES: cardiolipin synthase [Bacillus]